MIMTQPQIASILSLLSAGFGLWASWVLTESGRFLASESWKGETEAERLERSVRSGQLSLGRILLMLCFALQAASALVGYFA